LKKTGAAAGLGVAASLLSGKEEEEEGYKPGLEEAVTYDNLRTGSEPYPSKTESLTVEEQVNDDPLSEYRNEDGVVDTGGLQNAINDFITNEIETGQLQNVINEFIIGQ